jgi:hypothetical protein
VLTGQGKPAAETVRAIEVTESTYYRSLALRVWWAHGDLAIWAVRLVVKASVAF